MQKSYCHGNQSDKQTRIIYVPRHFDEEHGPCFESLQPFFPALPRGPGLHIDTKSYCTVNPEIFARILFSRTALKDILATGNFRD